MTIATTVFDHPNFDQHEDVVFISDRSSGLRGIIALHSTQLGPALGGTRMLRYSESGAALTDALRLSRGMTAKAAIAGLPLGGGKAVIIEDPAADRQAVLKAYAAHVERLGGRFVTGADVGISEADADLIHHQTRYIAGVSNREGGLAIPAPAPRKGCSARCTPPCLGCAETAASSVAGWWSVTAALDVPIEVVDPGQAHNVEADIFAPCALGAVLNPVTIGELRCAAVVGSANNQLADDACAPMLADRVAAIESTVAGLLDLADVRHTTPAAAADELVSLRLEGPSSEA